MKAKTDFNWKKYLAACMKSTDFCSLSTVGEKGVWSCPVYFAWDERFNLYFISQMSSRHMQNISENPQVAISIYKTEQEGDVHGIQMEGTAEILKQDDEKKIGQAYNTYYKRAGHGPDAEHYKNDPTWLYVRVTPKQYYYFDTRFFDEERQTVPVKALK